MSIKHTLPFLLGLAAVTPAMACAPTPSCWIEEGPAYLRDVCADYAKDHKTLAQIAPYLDAPEQIGAFAKACAKVHVHLKAGATELESSAACFVVQPTDGNGGGMATCDARKHTIRFLSR
jgi:hypothetical protein